MQNSDIVVGLPTIFGKWFTGILCLLKEPEIMKEAYKKVGRAQPEVDSILNYSTGCRQALCYTDFDGISHLHIGYQTYP